jgi:cholesterol oxidase
LSTELTIDELGSLNGRQWYRRHVVPGYGHIDCSFGKNAVKDVYPVMLEHLDATER